MVIEGYWKLKYYIFNEYKQKLFANKLDKWIVKSLAWIFPEYCIIIHITD